MGSPQGEACRRDDEDPLHSVTITRPFYMQQTEVTQGDWHRLIGNNPSHFSDCGEDCPVETVSWYDAVFYANKLSQHEGFEQCYIITHSTGEPGTGNYTATVEFAGLNCKGYRLPTEAEWEYAARAGTTTAYWIGSNIGDGGHEVCGCGDPLGVLIPEAGWYRYNSDGTRQVAQKEANPFGLYDVHGNVWEWVFDWHSPNYYGTCDEVCKDPQGPTEGSERVHRGGSWFDCANYLRSAVRSKGAPDGRHGNVGFRLVRSVVIETE
ncbi:MAG TPA: formylglycine-generating enzyme family protein, partial [Oligoflexales bacterium]|nr:formylglycine-generating enzyme family protein [Oligoflexales bacterium]